MPGGGSGFSNRDERTEDDGWRGDDGRVHSRAWVAGAPVAAEVPDPVPAIGQIGVGVTATGIDVSETRGRPGARSCQGAGPPFPPGHEIGSESGRAACGALNAGGRFAAFGFAAGTLAKATLAEVLGRGGTAIGFGGPRLASRPGHAHDLEAAALTGVAAGRLRPVTGQRFPLARAVAPMLPWHPAPPPERRC